jgi:hypothetical protein
MTSLSHRATFSAVSNLDERGERHEQGASAEEAAVLLRAPSLRAKPSSLGTGTRNLSGRLGSGALNHGAVEHYWKAMPSIQIRNGGLSHESNPIVR